MLSKNQLCLPKSKSSFGNTMKRWENHLFGKKENCLFTILHPCDMSWISTTLYYILYVIYFIHFSSTKIERSNLFQKVLPCNSAKFLIFVALIANMLCWLPGNSAGGFFLGGEMLIIKRAPFKGCQFLPPTESWFLKVTACLNRHPR